MSKLEEHFRKMQEMAGRYLIPEPYVSIRGYRSDELTQFPISKDDLFIGDMLEMLDGPEQREALPNDHA